MLVTFLCFDGPIATKCVSLNKKQYTIRLDLNPDQLNQGLHYYSFMVSLDRSYRSCNTIDNSHGKLWVPNKKEDVKSKWIKTTKKHISCNYRCRFMAENEI